MIVCAHGDVTKYCETHDMLIVEEFEGELGNYKGSCLVLVTDRRMTKVEYLFYKGKMLAKGVELVCIHHKDNPSIAHYLGFVERKNKTGGRTMFGLYRKDGRIVAIPGGMEVVRRVIEMRDAGYTMKAISADPRVHHPDGRKLSISTIQMILKHREKYKEYLGGTKNG